ncbi:MAG: HAMP domain-containing protein [Actinobacteria bacterium]|nr:HAMP domain-containing protein [Actinomycetota bacterium]
MTAKPALEPAPEKKGSKTLYQITILIVIVYVAAGLAAYFVYNRSQDRLIDNSRDKLIQIGVESVSANTSFVLDFLVFLNQEQLQDLDVISLNQAIAEGRLTPGQERLDEQLAGMVAADFMGLEGVVLFSSPGGDGVNTVIAASDPDLVYAWEVPGEFGEAAAAHAGYLLTDNGVPGLGPGGQSLVVVGEATINDAGLRAGYLAVKPVAGEFAAINAFFDEKKSDGSRNLALMMVISVVAASLLTFIFITILIRRRITRPIDELSSAAKQVMEGDLDVETPVRRGDEFEGLERSFNTMVKSLSRILSLPLAESTEGSDPGPQEASVSQRLPAKRGKESIPGAGLAPGKSRTLGYITCFLAVVFVAWGLVTFAIFNHWQNELIDAGRNKLIEETSQYFINASHYIRDTLDPVITEKMEKEGLTNLSLEEQSALMLRGEISDYQHFYNEFSRQLVELGALDMQRVLVVLSGEYIPGGSIVVVSDDESMVYNWSVPDYLLEAIDNGEPYLYREEGIEELGLEGEHIIAIEVFDLRGVTQAYIGVKSMHAEIMQMRDFYNEEKESIYITLLPVMSGALLAFMLLTFLVMRFLIHRNITGPVVELSAAVSEVMDGNLDVDIPLREGEELEGLKLAFREMVESFRRLMTRATE